MQLSHCRRALCLALVGGCGGGVENPVVETEHLVIELYDSNRLCQGSVQNMESQVQRIGEILSTEIPRPIYIHFGPSAVEERCSDVHNGCTKSAQDVAATDSSVFHELVHAVRFAKGGVGIRLFEEGIADALSGFRPYPYQVSLDPNGVPRSPLDLAGGAWGAFTVEDYVTAGHFVSWLWNSYGKDSLVKFLNSSAYTTKVDVGGAFVESMGVSIAEADDLWRTMSASGYSWGSFCDPSRLLTWDGLSLDFSGEVDCSKDHTVGPGYDGRISTFGYCFDLQKPGNVHFEFSASASRAFVTVRQFACEPDQFLGFEYYDLKIVYADTPVVLPLGACRWELSVTNPGNLHESRDPVAALQFTVRLTQG